MERLNIEPIKGDKIMKRIIELSLICIFLMSFEHGFAASKIQTQTIELSYFNNVTVTEILKTVKMHGLRVHEKNPPKKIKVSDNLIMFNNFFSDFYRKKDGNYEYDIAVTGLNDNLGSVSITVRNFRQNRNNLKMQEIFNNLVSDLPKALLPPTVEGENFVKSLSRNLESSRIDGIFAQTINGIQYRFTIFDTEIFIDIAKEGN